MMQEVVDVDDYELLKRTVEEVDGQKMMQEVGVEDEQETMTPAEEAGERVMMMMQEVGVEDEQETMTPAEETGERVMMMLEVAEADEQRKMIEEEPD
jgi:hypothetical protein